MIGRVLLAALLAGIVAGLFMSVIQHVRLTPLILEAEKFETASHQHGDAEAAASEAHDHADGGWQPADGLERTLFTTLSWSVAGAAFAALLAGVSLLIDIPISRRNGVLWGLAGFFCVMLAPAAGLAPELPGMPAADLVARQVWWGGTIIATGAGLYLLATMPKWWTLPVAVFLIALPHVIGAPVPPAHETLVPAGIAASFAANAIAASAVFWAVLGALLGLAMEKFARPGELT
jgi:cobalt transporter subunit CbtA